MKIVDRLLTFSLVMAIVLLTLTAIPAVTTGHLGGSMLMGHMVASGVLVFVLPIYALRFLGRSIRSDASTWLGRIGFWSLVATGLVTIATIFACMLPIMSTDEMREVATIHGYAGLAMVPALLASLVGAAHWRRIHATRSATPG